MSNNALDAIRESDAKFKKWIRHHVPPLSTTASAADTVDDAATLAAFTGSTNIVTLGNLPSVGIGIAPPPVANGQPRLWIRGSTAASPVARFQTNTLTNPFLEMWVQSGLSWLGGDPGGVGNQSIYFDNTGNTGIAGSTVGIGPDLNTTFYATFSSSVASFITPVQITSIAHETTNVNTFLVSNSGNIKYRTGTEVLSDTGVTTTAAKLNFLTTAAGTTGTATTNIVFSTSPVLTTPNIGAATATSINGNTFTAGSYTLAGQAGKTLTFNGTITLTGTDAQTYTFPATTATLARTDAANTFTGHQTIEGVTSTGATGTGKFVFDGTPTIVTPNFTTGFTIGVTAATGTFPRGNGTNFVASALILPIGSTTGDVFVSTATNTVGVVAVQGTANKILMAGGNAVPTWSIPAYPNASATLNKWIRSNGTDFVASASTLSDTPGTAGHIPISDGTNWITSTPTIPNTTGTVGQYVVSDGTNMVFGSGVGQDAIIANSAAINTTETVITKTVALAANRLLAGTTIRVTLIGTCTSTVANTSTFTIRIGTNGSTADGIMQQAVTSVAAASGTNVPFKAVFEFTVRTTGASATSHGYLTLLNTGVTGISAQTTQIVLPTFTNFNTTTASNIISATYVSAAATTTTTFNDAFIEVIYK